MLSGADVRDTRASTESMASQTGIDPNIAEVMNLLDAGRIAEAESLFAEMQKQQGFEMGQGIPFFLQLAKKLDAVNAFQQFRLPGSDRVVVDRREQENGRPEEAAKEAAKEVAKENVKEAVKEKAKETAEKKGSEAADTMRLLDGKLVKEKDVAYKKHLGDKGPSSLDQEAASTRVERLLSEFEKMVIARFENGQKIAAENAAGKQVFLGKTLAEWRDFFSSFADRTVLKKVLLSEIQEFLFRGLVLKGAKGVLIGDMILNGGRVEKFVRFSILAETLAKLRMLSPGDAFGKGALGNLTSEELMYLALSISRGSEYATSMLPTQGKFMGSRAEEQAAQSLGIPLNEHLKQKAKLLRGRKGGGFGRFGDGEPEDLPYRFVPWWQWGNLKRPGKFRWTTAMFYLTLLALALIGIGAVTYRLLGG